jgi:hypothetical protein
VAIDGEGVAEQQPTPLDVLIPMWARVLAAGVLVVLVANLWLRIGVLMDEERAPAALIELGIGLVSMAAAHLTAFLYALLKDGSCSPFDFFMRPIALWKPALQLLPAKAWRVWMMSWGLTAAVSAVTIVGGINYMAIFDDWGFEKRAQPTIIQAVVDQARREGEGAESLEDAMNEFTGKPGEDEPAENLTYADCLVFGYTANQEGEVRHLLLAGVVESKLKFVGKLSFADLPAETQATIGARLPKLGRKKSFVKIPLAAKWLEPKIMCTIGFAGWGDDKLMRHPRFVRLLADAR